MFLNLSDLRTSARKLFSFLPGGGVKAGDKTEAESPNFAVMTVSGSQGTHASQLPRVKLSAGLPSGRRISRVIWLWKFFRETERVLTLIRPREA